MQMRSNFTQAYGGIGANTSLIVSGLQTGKVPEHLYVEVVVIELRRQMDDWLRRERMISQPSQKEERIREHIIYFHCLLSNRWIGVQEAVRHLRKYLIIDYRWLQMSYKQFQLLQKSRTSHTIGWGE